MCISFSKIFLSYLNILIIYVHKTQEIRADACGVHHSTVQEACNEALKSSSDTLEFVRFEVLMAACMKMAVFWVVVPCSLVDYMALQPRRQPSSI
jgi:hypothetical protein